MFKLDTALNAALYILNNTNGNLQTINVLFLLYFADKYSLSHFARTITDDTYFKMDGIFGIGTCRILFEIHDVIEPNMDYLSVSDKESLDYAIRMYSNCTTEELIEKTKGFAYNNTKQCNMVSLSDIMIEEGCDNEYIDYVVELDNIQKSLL